MGLGIAIGGGVIMAVLVTVIITVMMLIPQGAIVQESMHDSFQLSNKYEKTSFTFDSTSAESGLSEFSFVLENTGLEKLWNYEDSNVFVTYDALIDGARTSITETPSYYSSSNISIECDGTSGGELPSGNWTISQIIGDGLDPGLINSNEKAEIVTKLTYPLYNETSTISLTFASDVGQTQTISFDTDDSDCAWYSPNWLSRELIRINHDQVTGNLTNFPVMISIVDTDLQSDAQADGDDILFTSEDKITKLFHEIEEYDDSDGTLVAWVNIPSLSSIVDTDIYMYYGNSFASNQQNVQNVWDDDFIMIQHLNETSGIRTDSTQYDNDGTISGNVAHTVSGFISGADDFDGFNSVIDISTSSSLNSLDTMTAEAWINADNVAADTAIISFWYSSTDRTYLWLDDLTNGFRAWNSLNGHDEFEATSYVVPEEDEWYHIAWTIDGTYWKLFINGVAQDSTTESLTMDDLNDGFSVGIGERITQYDRTWDGFIDEVRISDVARSSDWMSTQYNNQRFQNTFYTVDPNEEFADWYDPTWSYRKTITIANAQVPEYQINFPVLMNFTDSDLRDNAQSDGSDIVFTATNGRVQLDHEIEKYDNSDGTLVAWVKVPQLYSLTDTTLYMYYGHGVTESQENPTGVWTNGYESVYHLNDDFEDSTDNNRDAANSGSVDAVGLLADAQDFEGTDGSDHLDLGTWNVSGDEITIQSWAKFESFSESSRLISKASSSSPDDHVYGLAMDNSGRPYFFLMLCDDDDCETSILTDSSIFESGKWNLVTGTYDGSWMRLFVNGTQVASTSDSGNLGQNNWDIYAGNNPILLDRDFDGLLDEIRISSSARSGNWLTTEFNNQVSSDTFYSIGSAEALGS